MGKCCDRPRSKGFLEMKKLASPATGPVCVPGAIPAKQRAGHFALAQELLVRRTQLRSALPNGYEFRFAAEDLTSLAAFVENERKCCPLLAFEIGVPPGSGPISLRMTGPAGTCEMLQAQLTLPVSCGCSREGQASACGATGVSGTGNRWLTRAVTGGIMAAVGACAACCLVPAAAIGVGIAGVWAGAMHWLGASVWALIGLAAVLSGYACYRQYVKPRP